MSSLFNCNLFVIPLLESRSIVDLNTPKSLSEKTPQIQVVIMPNGHALVYLSERPKSSSARAIIMHLLVSLTCSLSLLLPHQSLVHNLFQTARQQVWVLNAIARVNAAWFYSNMLTLYLQITLPCVAQLWVKPAAASSLMPLYQNPSTDLTLFLHHLLLCSPLYKSPCFKGKFPETSASSFLMFSRRHLPVVTNKQGFIFRLQAGEPFFHQPWCVSYSGK